MWPFKKKEKSNIIVPSTPVVHIPRKLEKFRRGMWVNYQGRVGILHKMDGVLAEVHLVDKDGLTEEIVKAEVREICQAGKSQVPECRRGNIDKFDYPE